MKKKKKTASSIKKSELKFQAPLAFCLQACYFPHMNLWLEVSNLSEVNITKVHQYFWFSLLLSTRRTVLVVMRFVLINTVWAEASIHFPASLSSATANSEGSYQEGSIRTSLVVQWLRLCTPNAEGSGSIPGQRTWFHMLQWRGHMPLLKDPVCLN